MKTVRPLAMRLLNPNKFLLACLMAISFSSTAVFAQSVTGTLLGTVTDPTGAVVQNAKVTATQTGTNVARETTSNESGNFSMPDLPPARIPSQS